MRFLIDAQLPPALCAWFEERGFAAEHVAERLEGQTADSETAAAIRQIASNMQTRSATIKKYWSLD